MVVMSIERVRCVLPARGHDVVTTTDSRSIGVRGTLIVLAMVWMSSVVLSAPTAVNFDVGVADDINASNHSTMVCQPTWSSIQTSVYSLFVLAVSYLLPQAIIYVNYGRLAAYLWKRRAAVTTVNVQPQTSDGGSQPRRPGGGGASITRSTVKSVKMLVTISVLFLASWAPYFTIMTIEVICIPFYSINMLYSVHIALL